MWYGFLNGSYIWTLCVVSASQNVSAVLALGTQLPRSLRRGVSSHLADEGPPSWLKDDGLKVY